MVDPPFEVGANHVIVACVSPAVATGFNGAPGSGAAGITLFEKDDSGELPMAFVACTVNA
jgi:hypothetical protein